MAWQEDNFLEELSNDLDAANREVHEHISVVRIPIEELKEHESNFYIINGIEALAEELKVMGGELSNPIKVFKNNTIISGHRRFNAFKLLAETDERFNTIPAIYVDNFETEEEELLYLMNENNQRVKTKEELAVEIQLKKELYVTLKENGDERYQSVNINKLLAEEFGMSETSIKRATGNAKATKQKKSNSVLSMERNIQERLSTKAVITGNEKGYLKIRFESVDNLNDLLEQMNLITEDWWEDIMETKTHIGIHFEKGKMYGRNKISYCWEEMDHVVPVNQYEELLAKLEWKEATLKDGKKFKSIEVFAIQDGEVHGFEKKICNISDLYELK